ncbi:citrate transporter [Sphingomonas sp. So64.6b]|uniref:CitMHS family transporter n=1 Tax=Sphingomonas sp. So64.6b TaxID=2997354 RepID=UPI00160250A9|nr:citrate:proton symporter [Sphingomonas sp. So64.6b]QNA82884.1 citrate transporter [Sphingomonas sp. So64.6b]
MLMLLGYLMVATFMILIMTRRLSALVALILVPLIFGVVAGHGADLGPMAVDGLAKLAPTAALLLFAVLFFAIMIDAGLFEPLVTRILRFAGDDPVRVAVGTAMMASVVSLDGDGATTALITITAFLPVYRRLGMNPLVLAVILASANTVINLAPWGGPTGRVAAALRLDVADVFVPLLPAMVAGIVATFGIAWYLGRAERRRLAAAPGGGSSPSTDSASIVAPLIGGEVDAATAALRRPRLFVVNLLLTIAVIGLAVLHIVPLPLVFMVGLSIALMVNYPRLNDQRDRLAAHAATALPILILILAAGVFTGVMAGTGMVDAMAKGAMTTIPPSLGPWLGPITAFMAAPLTFALSNDAFYFGVVPVIAQTAAQYGIAPVEIGRASLLAQPIHALSPLLAALYFSSGLLGVDVGALQRFALKWACLLTLVLIATAWLTGAIT